MSQKRPRANCPLSQRERRELRAGLFFTGPWLIGMTLFIGLPLAMTVWFSLCDYSVLKRPVFVGATNYTDLAHDEVFWVSLKNTLYYGAVALPLGTALSLALALLLNARIAARPVFRAIFFLPSLVPLVALAILWQWMFNAQYGIVNYSLSGLGIQGPDWLGDPAWAKPAIVLTGLWGVGGAVVIYLAALQDVPVSLYEAATIDGASWWHKTWHITLPMISPVIYFNLLMGAIGALQIFAVPFVMTGGGPARSTLFYTIYLFNHAFRYLNMGYACAMALVLFVLIAGLTYAVHLLMKRHVYYAGG